MFNPLQKTSFSGVLKRASLTVMLVSQLLFVANLSTASAVDINPYRLQNWYDGSVHAAAANPQPSLGSPNTGPMRGKRRCTLPDAGQKWPTLSPEEAGLDRGELEKALRTAARYPVQVFRIYRYGCLVSALEDPYPDNDAPLWSITKTLAMIGYGAAVSDGLMDDRTDKIGTWIKEAPADRRNILLSDVLRMQSGIALSFIPDIFADMGNSLDIAMNARIYHKPGEYWAYGQNPPQFILESVQRAVGQDFIQYMDKRVFRPIGIQRSDWEWMRDGSGKAVAGGAVNMKPEALMRIAHMWMSGGNWKGKQIVNRQFFKRAMTPAKTNPGFGYMGMWLDPRKARDLTPEGAPPPQAGEQMWPAPRGSYQTTGFGTQMVGFIPKLDMIIERLAPFSFGHFPTTEENMSEPGSISAFWEPLRGVMKAVKNAPVPPDVGPFSDVKFPNRGVLKSNPKLTFDNDLMGDTLLAPTRQGEALCAFWVCPKNHAW